VVASLKLSGSDSGDKCTDCEKLKCELKAACQAVFSKSIQDLSPSSSEEPTCEIFEPRSQHIIDWKGTVARKDKSNLIFETKLRVSFCERVLPSYQFCITLEALEAWIHCAAEHEPQLLLEAVNVLFQAYYIGNKGQETPVQLETTAGTMAKVFASDPMATNHMEFKAGPVTDLSATLTVNTLGGAATGGSASAAGKRAVSQQSVDSNDSPVIWVPPQLTSNRDLNGVQEIQLFRDQERAKIWKARRSGCDNGPLLEFNYQGKEKVYVENTHKISLVILSARMKGSFMDFEQENKSRTKSVMKAQNRPVIIQFPFSMKLVPEQEGR